MRNLALPFTLPLVAVCVFLLLVFAGLSRTFAWCAGRVATLAVLIVLWQRSTMLLKFITPTTNNVKEDQ